MGESGRRFRQGFGEHRRFVIKNDAKKPVTTHFNVAHHTFD